MFRILNKTFSNSKRPIFSLQTGDEVEERNKEKEELVTAMNRSVQELQALRIATEKVEIRVATAQGKQGIWLLTFPDRENTGNLLNLIFHTGKIVATQGKF